VIADKGFGSDDDFAAITGSGMHYIIPLKRNTAEAQIPA
jgi:transposase